MKHRLLENFPLTSMRRSLENKFTLYSNVPIYDIRYETLHLYIIYTYSVTKVTRVLVHALYYLFECNTDISVGFININIYYYAHSYIIYYIYIRKHRRRFALKFTTVGGRLARYYYYNIFIIRYKIIYLNAVHMTYNNHVCMCVLCCVYYTDAASNEAFKSLRYVHVNYTLLHRQWRFMPFSLHVDYIYVYSIFMYVLHFTVDLFDHTTPNEYY